MFVAITNTPRDYAWGSPTAIAELLGSRPSGGPEAELWLGAHPGSPARIVGAEDAAPDLSPSLPATAATGGARDLAEWIAADPEAALGGHPRLPFLLKVLAAAGPLSLQAHPDAARAAAGFARENALGIPLDAPNRNYRDAYPKPEIIVALSERFVALCGFRPIEEAWAVFMALGLDELAPQLDSLPDLFARLLSGGPDVDALVARVTAAAGVTAAGADLVGRTNLKEIHPQSDLSGAELGDSDRNSVVFGALETVRTLAHWFPGDTGILSALLLNRVTLARGEALFLPAGNIHAYLSGLGIELMTASDNVLRGGLTPKHVDVDELLAVLDFTPQPVPYLEPERTEGLSVYRPDGAGFVLAHVTADARLPLTGPAIAVCTGGGFAIDGETTSGAIVRGQVLYVTSDEGALAFAGAGDLFVATTA
ncbi:mannose-6-phosphate isomerase, class I [Leifsonia bigeumensis]|uniref:mannose-6-phosphate isomerase n=1 Tax=Leifsonella bigeumensis TaxID=433643 RepID=A0ABP7FBU5_9MICO